MTPEALRGRVLRSNADELWLQVPGGEIVVRPADGRESRPEPGDLVELQDGAWVTVHRHPTGTYPRPESDEVRFSEPRRWSRLRRRAEILRSTRSVFEARGFLEVETPLCVPCPGTEVHIEVTATRQRSRPGGPAEDRFLIPSPEHHMKRLLAGGAPAIFQVARVFRDGERGHQHRPEFTLVEWYRPWEPPAAIQSDCEAWLWALAGGQRELTYQGLKLDLTPPWPRRRFLDALRELARIDEPERLTPEEQLRAVVEEVEPRLGRERPEFLTHYPISMASLARPVPGEEHLADRFELFAGGLELGNGFGELTDPTVQRERFNADNEQRSALGMRNLPIDEAFLGALETGMPPASGMAIGLDRVVMLFADVADIDQILSF